MWKRSQVKERGKISFKRNYWKCVLISLLLTLIIGGGSSAANSISDSASGKVQDNVTDQSGTYDNDDTDDLEKDMTALLEDLGNEPGGVAAIAIFVIVFLVVFLICMAIVLIMDIFIVNPLEVGCRRYFVRNLNEPAQAGNVGYAFDNNYKTITKTMFFRDLYTVLWSLLFVIPGLVKAYEYMMIPYLLADNPQMTKEQAFAESKRMMHGNKWKAFVLDLSFIGWHILSAFTLGILEIFYVAPYVNATHAALYEALRYGNPVNSQNTVNYENTMNNGAFNN